VDDFPPTDPKNIGRDQHCENKHVTHAAVIVPREDGTLNERTQLILCRDLFLLGTIDGGKGKEWPDTANRKCSNIGDRVSEYMLTLGTVMLHEYTHADDLVVPPLKEETDDLAYSFYDARNLKKDLATRNADNFALFAIELTWTVLCNRAFAPPIKENTPRLPATGSRGQRPRRDVRLAPSLHKRTPLPRNYGVRTPNTQRDYQGIKENTYNAQQIEQFQEGHSDALMMCNMVVREATRNPNRFDRIFREYFPTSDRQLVIGEYAITEMLMIVVIASTLRLTEYSQMCSKRSLTLTGTRKAIQNSKILTLWTTSYSQRAIRSSIAHAAMPPPGPYRNMKMRQNTGHK
jgi:hypothetical protein